MVRDDRLQRVIDNANLPEEDLLAAERVLDSQQEALEAIISVASQRDLLTNAVARAMNEYALRGLGRKPW